jgi:hypothetical protein
MQPPTRLTRTSLIGFHDTQLSNLNFFEGNSVTDKGWQILRERFAVKRRGKATCERRVKDPTSWFGLFLYEGRLGFTVEGWQ